MPNYSSHFATIDPNESHQLQRELMRLSSQLGACVHPAHCDYISKKDAAKWCENLATRLAAATNVMPLPPVEGKA